MSERFSVVGQVLAERYQLEEVLGKGAMGAVYRATDRKLRQPCAVKVLHRLVDGQDELYSRFVTEAAAITQLFHPNIVQVREFGQDRGTPFLVMEFLRGRDLHSLLQERTRLSLMQTLDVLRQVGSALHCAHTQGIVHRDIKPKNIFLGRQNNAYGDDFEVVKVVDFGLSKFLGRKGRNETNAGMILGTPEYLSPEATLGIPSAVDYRTDQWALGVMAYRLLSGQLPFDSDDMLSLLLEIRDRQPAPLSRLVPELPPHVDAAIRRALAKKKEDRFATVQDFVRALDDLPSASLALQPQGSLPAQGAPTLLLPQIPQLGTVLSVPEPVIFEVSKRLRDALATRPSGGPASTPRSDGVPRVEVHAETTRPRPVGEVRMPRLRRYAAGVSFLVSMGLFGSISTHLLLNNARGTVAGTTQGEPPESPRLDAPLGALPLLATVPAVAGQPGQPGQDEGSGSEPAARVHRTGGADAVAIPEVPRNNRPSPGNGTGRRPKSTPRGGHSSSPRGDGKSSLARAGDGSPVGEHLGTDGRSVSATSLTTPLAAPLSPTQPAPAAPGPERIAVVD